MNTVSPRRYAAGMTSTHDREETMSDSRSGETVARPTECPFCHGRAVDTLARIITVTTCWRCRHCDATWTIAGLPGASAQPR